MQKRESKAVLSAVIAVTVIAFQGLAQQATKIAGVDLQRTLEQSAEGKSVISQLKQKEQSVLSELDRYDKQILSLETKLKTQRLTLAEEAQQKLSLELETARTQRKRAEEDAARDFQRLQFNLVSNLRNEIVAVVETYAKENRIGLVFDLSSAGPVLYCEPVLDITAEIIKRYDSSKAEKKQDC